MPPSHPDEVPVPRQICSVCAGRLEMLLDAGCPPLTNRFPAAADEVLCRYPLVLGQCPRCGLIQLLTPAPPALLRPPQPVYYNEPEGHLDALVELLTRLPGVLPASSFAGVTYKEESTLARLARRGYDRGMTFFAGRVVGGEPPETSPPVACHLEPGHLEPGHLEPGHWGLETIQAEVTPAWAEKIRSTVGPVEVLIVRHLLEHAHDPRGFLTALQRLVAPGGYLVLEVPDGTTFLQRGDYSFLWEEHVSYFTPATLVGTLERSGLSVASVVNYPYPLENSLVAIARVPVERASPTVSAPGGTAERGALGSVGATAELASQLQLGRDFAANFGMVRGAWHARLRELRASGPLVLLGIGHLAVTFVNLMELESLIDRVCDDDPAKIGCWLPGTRLRIEPCEILGEGPIQVCLLGVAAESEPKVFARQRGFLDRGGRFLSIFSASPYAAR